ncbi:MAG: lactate utilization protein [Ruminococcaceae bacterium]|nr:lactate utilization protein [Oscillospiraceae bacterium]
MEARIEKTMKALERNRMKPYYAETREQLHDIVRELIKDDKLITAGGSMSLKESGVTDLLLSEYKDVYAHRFDGSSPDEIEDVLHKAFVSDTFFASTNALTEDGALYNVDGKGNRVSAMIYGPKQVVLVVGVNKIVKDMDEAVRRVELIAAPKNTVRLNCATPCAKTGECAHCSGDGRICCSFVRLEQQRVKDRIKVIIVNEELGF